MHFIEPSTTYSHVSAQETYKDVYNFDESKETTYYFYGK